MITESDGLFYVFEHEGGDCIGIFTTRSAAAQRLLAWLD